MAHLGDPHQQPAPISDQNPLSGNLPPRPAIDRIGFGQGGQYGFDRLGPQVAAFLNSLGAESAAVEQKQGIDHCSIKFAAPCEQAVTGVPLVKRIVFDQELNFRAIQHSDKSIEVLSIKGVKLEVGVLFATKLISPPSATIYPDGTADVKLVPKRISLGPLGNVIQQMVQNCNALRQGP